MTSDQLIAEGRRLQRPVVLLTPEGTGSVAAVWYERDADLVRTPLYPREASVIPPIDVVFARGSDVVAEWLRANGWKREWPYNPNFKDREPARS